MRAKPSRDQRAHDPQEAWVAASESVSGYRVVDAFSMFEICPEINLPGCSRSSSLISTKPPIALSRAICLALEVHPER
jgi:hypothetical protein